MSWKVEVKRIESIHPIEGADAIETAIIGNGWPVVVRKGQYKPQDRIIYYPKDSLMPPEILERIGLTGKLSGSNKNRVKAIKLRGQLSIGIVEPAAADLPEDECLAERLGIKHYEAEIEWQREVGIQLRGRQRPKPPGFIKYDLENIRSKDPFIEGEEVICEEKLDGSHLSLCLIDGVFYVNSRNLCIERDENNSYWKAAIRHGIEEKARSLGINNFWMEGELLPITKLTYGLKEIQARFYEVRVEDRFFDYDEARELFSKLELPVPPVLYRGPYNKELPNAHAIGKETVSGQSLHIREGCVIRPVKERFQHRLGRVIMKSVNPEYLLKHDDGVQ